MYRVLILFIAFSLHAFAKPLEISDAWARRSMSSTGNSVVYMKVSNPNDKQVTILGASAIEFANNVELHTSFTDEKGISRMTLINNIVVPARSTILLEPGGMHIMLLGLKKKLILGDSMSLIIKVSGMKPIPIEATIR